MSLTPAVLVVAGGLPAIGLVRQHRTTTPPDWQRLRRSFGLNIVVVLGLSALVLSAGGLEALGVRVPSVGVLVDGVLFGFIAFAGTMLAVTLLARMFSGVTADEATHVVLEQPPSRRLAVAVAGALAESITATRAITRRRRTARRVASRAVRAAEWFYIGTE